VPRALEAVRTRAGSVQSWYLDVTLLQQYWGEDRVYHHTAPISMNYALREALRLVAEEGLEARFARHRVNHEALAAGLAALGLALASEEGHRLPMLNAVTVPAGVDEARVAESAPRRDGIEIGGGLGPMKGASGGSGSWANRAAARERAVRARGAGAGARGRGTSGDGRARRSRPPRASTPREPARRRSVARLPGRRRRVRGRCVPACAPAPRRPRAASPGVQR
jgi:alanine-glyoxylate transaminase/serine-glyoxylate transaminase/serine-pyruvate transaminase